MCSKTVKFHLVELTETLIGLRLELDAYKDLLRGYANQIEEEFEQSEKLLIMSKIDGTPISDQPRTLQTQPVEGDMDASSLLAMLRR